MLAGAALAEEPDPSTVFAALAYVDPRIEAAETELGWARARLDPSRILDASLILTPEVAAVGEPPDLGAPVIDASLQVEAEMGVTLDARRRLLDEERMVRARQRLEAIRREGAEDALLAHARLLRAAAEAALEDERTAAAERTLAQREGREGDARDEARIEDARLDLRERRLRLARAREVLADARAQAERFGLAPDARYQVVRFDLPAPDDRGGTRALLLELALSRAREAHTRQALFGTLRELRVTGETRNDDVGVGFSVGIEERKPRASVYADAPGGSPRWSVGVEATLAFDTDLARLPELAYRVEEAARALADFRRDAPQEATRDRDEVRYVMGLLEVDEARLALADERYDRARATTRARRDELMREVDDERSGGGAGEGAEGEGPEVGGIEVEGPEAGGPEAGPDPQGLEDAWSRAVEDQRDAYADVLRARVDAYASWARYVRAVGAYLDTVEGSWVVR
jgi:hypothetical protein